MLGRDRAEESRLVILPEEYESGEDGIERKSVKEGREDLMRAKRRERVGSNSISSCNTSGRATEDDSINGVR